MRKTDIDKRLEYETKLRGDIESNRKRFRYCWYWIKNTPNMELISNVISNL